MALIILPYTFSVGATIIAAQHNSNFQTIYNDYNGNVIDANIASNAAIAYTKLALTGSIKLSDLVSAVSGYLVPAGAIIMWSGTIATIPSGWVLCNGSNSTPDLRNLFIVGANADSGGLAKSTITGSALQTGGSVTITTGNLPASGIIIPTNNSGSSFGSTSIAMSNQAANTTVTSNNLGSGNAYTQPFFALAFIMKT